MQHKGFDSRPGEYPAATSRAFTSPVRGHHAGPAGNRDYLLYAPPAEPHAGGSLIIMLHGCHQAAADFARATRMQDHAAGHPCYVAYPAQALQANGAKCWNWWDAAHQQRELGEPAIIADLTRHLVTRYAIAAEQVFIVVFSAGGAMAATMAVLYPDLYSACLHGPGALEQRSACGALDNYLPRKMKECMMLHRNILVLSGNSSFPLVICVMRAA